MDTLIECSRTFYNSLVKIYVFKASVIIIGIGIIKAIPIYIYKCKEKLVILQSIGIV